MCDVVRCKVSVVVPVYNAERHLCACIESLLSQTLKECEFIFVNDGSTDNSGTIIDSYRLKDQRIKPIVQANKGVSCARNAGLAAAAGEYVGFVDADDTVEPDMFETLYLAAAGRYDAVLSDYETESGKTRSIVSCPLPAGIPLDRTFIAENLLPLFLERDILNNVWTKLYRTDTIRSHEIIFPEGVALGEDWQFNMSFFGAASAATYIEYAGYRYREVAGSATRSIAGKDLFSRALEAYLSDPPPAFASLMPEQRIRRLKAVRLVHSTLSYIYLYLKPGSDMSFGKRYGYVRRMIRSPYLREALPYYLDARTGAIGRYERWLLAMIRAGSTFGLLCAVSYSSIRNLSYSDMEA